MTGWRNRRGTSWALAVAMFAATTIAAHADVKDGVEAWGRGDYETAVAQWTGPAAKGDADALFNLGQAYKLGRGVSKDLARAEDFYARAAKKGHIRAADNYGILLFQSGRQSEAMPWLTASADRGEPRAMYILGIAAYNGDYAPKDPVRAYALMTRAASTGLQQAINSLAAMDDGMPLEQRQQGVALAQELDRNAAATRAGQMGAADLGAAPAPALAAAAPIAPRATGGAIERVDLPPARTAAPAAFGPAQTSAMAQAAPAMAPNGPVTAGADYAHPVTLPPRGAAASVTPVPPAHTAAPAMASAHPSPAMAVTHDSGGWRVQLGAFGQKTNADALWAKLHTRPEIVGHPRIDAGTGVARLMAGGYSEAGAKQACAALRAAGQTCLAVNH